MENRLENVNQGANFLRALERLAMKEDAHSASVVGAAPKISNTKTGKWVGKENNVAKDSDDDGDDVLSPSSSMSPPFLEAPVVPFATIC